MKWMVFTLLILSIVVLSACSTDNRSSVEQSPASSIITSSLSDGTFSIGASDDSLEFVGTGVGKRHPGTFSNWSGEVAVEDKKITTVGFTIDATSISTGIDGLDSHLKSSDFFLTSEYPEITFVSTDIIHSSPGEAIVTGELSLRKKTSEVSFPAAIDGKIVTGSFTLDTSPFIDKYAGVDQEVSVIFEVTLE
ncbi:MAG: YceI family protein [Nanobdellota archaeon]